MSFNRKKSQKKTPKKPIKSFEPKELLNIYSLAHIAFQSATDHLRYELGTKNHGVTQS